MNDLLGHRSVNRANAFQTIAVTLTDRIESHAADIAHEESNLHQTLEAAIQAYEPSSLFKRVDGPISRVKRAMVAAL
jgi:hypothetical protein